MIVRQRRRHASPEHFAKQTDARLDVASKAAGGDGEAVGGEVGRGLLGDREQRGGRERERSRAIKGSIVLDGALTLQAVERNGAREGFGPKPPVTDAPSSPVRAIMAQTLKRSTTVNRAFKGQVELLLLFMLVVVMVVVICTLKAMPVSPPKHPSVGSDPTYS